MPILRSFSLIPVRLAKLASEKGLFSGEISVLNKSDYLKGISHLNIRNKSEIRRLNKIFAIAVYLKLNKQSVGILIKLPLLRIYEIIHIFFKAYSGKKIYRVSLPILIMQFLRHVKFLFKRSNQSGYK